MSIEVRHGEQARDRLRQMLRSAAGNGFAGVERAGLAAEAEALVQRVLQDPKLPPGVRNELQQVLEALGRFDGLGRSDRAAIVARAQRVMLGLERTAGHRRPRKRGRAGGQDRSSIPPDDVRLLNGIGPSGADRLAARGIRGIEDLAHWLPLDYRDLRARTPVSDIADGELAVIEGVVESFRQGRFRGGRFMATLTMRVEPPDGEPVELEARWFHRVGGLAQKAKRDSRLVLVGTLKRFRGRPSMVHPDVRGPDDPVPPILVRYPEVEGVGQRTLAKWCKAAVARLAAEDGGARLERLPASVVAAEGLPGYVDALRMLHEPPADLSPDEVEALRRRRSPAHQRLAFDQLVFLQLRVALQRQRWRNQACVWTSPEAGVDRELLRASVPFELTEAQWRVIGEIESDLSAGHPMLRLLQGDVGSGKTVVAFAAAVAVARGGGQVALMAPTEVLAQQHLRTLRPWCEGAGLRLALLTGATGSAQRASLLALLAAGQVDVLVGTHALLVDDVEFARLGLVVVDEQHRFGVDQRIRLRRKGAAPHLLVMSATPIPRTLALTAYGDLDISVLDELPPGREPAETRVYSGRSGLDKARSTLVRSVQRGVQGFVVCPLVEASEALEVTHVDATAAALRSMLPDREVAVVHGRMASTDKLEAMARFRSGEVAVLVATTVIEVGVDVPDARVMLVEHAERFGLAQLHQLRGRIGRHDGPSLCLLHTAEGRGSDAARRLRVLRETHDGFEVAERDLALRGPGDLFGTQQAGASPLVLEVRWIAAAREAALALLAEDPGLQRHPVVAEELRRRGLDAGPLSG